MPHISGNFTFSASQKSILLPSMVSVSTVFGSCDCQFCGAGSCCSFTSMVSPDTCKLVKEMVEFSSLFPSAVGVEWQPHLKCKHLAMIPLIEC